MPLRASEIAKLRQKVASQERRRAIRTISDLHPKKTVPTVIAIIQEAISNIPAAERNSDLCQFLKYTETLLLDIHNKQHASFYRLPGILKEFKKEKILADLAELIRKVEVINLVPELLDICREAEVWLEGWHHHTLDMMEKDEQGQPKRDENGVYLKIDREDRMFYTIVGLTKMDIAEQYGKVASLLREKINACQPDQAVDGDGAATQATQATHAHLESRQQCNDEGLSKALADSESLSHEKRIQILICLVEEYELSPNQKKALKHLGENAIALMKGYLNNPYMLVFNAVSIPRGPFARTHAPLVEKNIKYIEEIDDPKEILEVLFEMRLTLTSECSIDLLPKIDALLLDAYTMLQKLPQNLQLRSVGH